MKMLQRLAGLVLAITCAPFASAQSAEETVLARFSTLRASDSIPTQEGRWVQPNNLTEKCELYMWGAADPTAKLKWLGDCQNGKASGLGLIINKFGAGGTSIALEEYGTTSADVVTYRQVGVGPQQKTIFKGRMKPGTSAGTVIRAGTVVTVGNTSKGNVAVNSTQQYCQDTECVRSVADHLSGSISYQLAGAGGYQISWIEYRAENQPLHAHRSLSMDGAMPVQKYVIDGGVYDLYHDLRSGDTHRVAFSERTNAVLALPIERFTSVRGAIDEAVIASNSKFASIFDRYCTAPKDPDVRTFCDPSSLLPSDPMLAPARAEINESNRAAYTYTQRSAATYNQHSAQVAHAQSQRLQQEAIAAEQQRQASQAALRRGFEALNEAGMSAQRAGQQMMQSYGTPQVQVPTLSSPPIVNCRTIGYITTCN